MSPATTPPHNPAAERATIAAALCPQPSEQRAQLLALANPDDFYDHAWGELWTTITRLHQTGTPITVPTIAAHLNRHGAGGRITEHDLANLFLEGTTVAQDTHARIVTHDAHRRRALIATYDLAARITDDTPWGDDLGTLAELHTNTLTGSNLGLIDLTTLDDNGPTPTLGKIDPDRHLFYPAAIHDLHGEPSVGKTWIALWAAVEALHAGLGSMLIDYEDTASTCRSRLLALGTTLDELTRFRYVPGRAFTEAELHELRTIAAGLNGGPIIIDAVAPALAAEGLDENSNTDVSNWIVRVPRPLARTGSPVILLDHVGKQKQDRARGARGAGAKLAAIDGASYEITGQGFSRTQTGRLHVKVAKDRHGHVGAVGSIAADLEIAPGHDDAVIVTPSRPNSPITHDGQFRPTVIMDKISAWAESMGDGFEFTASDLNPRSGDRPIPGEKKTITAARDALVREGHLAVRMEGEGVKIRAVYRLARPFTDDPGAKASAPPSRRTPDEPFAPPRAASRRLSAADAPDSRRNPTERPAPFAPPPLEGRPAARVESVPTEYPDDDIF